MSRETRIAINGGEASRLEVSYACAEIAEWQEAQRVGETREYLAQMRARSQEVSPWADEFFGEYL